MNGLILMYDPIPHVVGPSAQCILVRGVDGHPNFVFAFHMLPTFGNELILKDVYSAPNHGKCCRSACQSTQTPTCLSLA
eukprot:5531191-Pleurochrysis_carterae.AAC.3